MKKFLFIGLLFLLSNVSFGQVSPVRFQHLTIADGLSLSSVYCVHRDSKGYMWFGTEDGLNRFDGYHFKVFRSNSQDKNSIAYKWIEYIHEDNRGDLWFGSRGGLSHYNPRKAIFTNFKGNTHPNHSLLNDTVTGIMQSSADLLLVGTAGGLNTIDLLTHAVETITPIKGSVHIMVASDSSNVLIGTSKGAYILNSISHDFIELFPQKKQSIEAIVQHNSEVWLCGDQKMYHYNISKQKLTEVLPISSLSQDEHYESLLKDSNNRIWIGTNKGLYLFDSTRKSAQRIINATDTSHSLAINPSKPLQEDSHGYIWYGTHGFGVYRISPDLKMARYVHNPVDQNGISQNSINCIYIDEYSESVWLGTFGSGLNVYDPSANKFDLIKHNPLNANSLSSDFTWSICEANDSSLWIGSNDKGISRYIASEQRFLHYDHQPNKKGALSHSSVREIFEDSKGIIWVGTDGGGLNRFNSKTNHFSVFKHSPDDHGSISNNSVRVIFEDRQQQLWVGTRHGLNRYHRDSNRFTRYVNQPGDSTSLSHNFIYSAIIEDKQGYLWIGTYGGGLNRFDPKNGTFTCYSMDSETGSSLSNNIVFSIYEDKAGTLWIGTNEGLNALNPTTGAISFYGIADGLPNEVIYGILPDENENLWLSTNNGICCFNPHKKKCRNFDVHDGLQSNEFNGGAFHKGHTGYLYFGGVYGLNMILPDAISRNQTVNKPVITRLEVLGKKVKVLPTTMEQVEIQESDSLLIMNQHISHCDHIDLDYKQRFFSIEYSGMNHLFPEKTQYAYQLYPLDKEWHQAYHRNYVSYANVKPGKYIFRIRSTNADGHWAETPTQLNITIHPPFWKTYWFMGLELLAIIIVAIFIYRYLVKIKTNKLLRLQNIQIKEANHRLKESETRLKKMNATKDKFFSIISHDLKNPFTSLMSISDVMIANYDESDEEDRKLCLTRIDSSVKQIYALLENLLTWSRSQRGKICFHQKPFDLSMLICENANLYRLAAEKKNIQIKVHSADNIIAIGDRDTINTVIRNLMGNALKFTPSGGIIQLNIEANKDDWKVSIIDNGIGIPEENHSKLFCIDQKVKTNGTAGEKGTGLGLIICKEFVEKNGGQIGVESVPNEGSCFWFTIEK
ncbi:MAG: hypothetical protein JEZ14_16520 [Marinilabiliaceae bacterium]|nr:hypothetical protein [Marinilabiliaceae bacterium]